MSIFKIEGIKESPARKAFMVFNVLFLTALCIIMLLPLLKVFAESVSLKKYVDTGSVWFWPRGLNFEAYKYVFKDPGMMKAFLNSLFITTFGTAINLLLTSMLAYPLSRPDFLFKRFFLLMITVTLIFSAPMIPNYLLIKYLGMDNTFLAVIVPGAISGFNFFVLRSFFVSIPSDLIDSARIDGSTESGILFKIVMPVSKPAMATLALFYGVGHWNVLQGPLIYLRSSKLKTLQLKLYSMVMQDNIEIPDITHVMFSNESIKMATIVVATIPILLVYPYLQKYFEKGANLGSIKE